MGFSRILFPDGRFPARHARRGRTIARQWDKRPSAYSPPPFPFLRTRHARPESFFRSGNHCPALIRSTVLSRLGNSPTRRSSVQRTSQFIELRPHAPRPKPSTRGASSPRILFPPPEPHQFDLSVHPSPLRWRNSPPDDSLSDGQPRLLRFQTPAPATRHAPWEGGPTEEGESMHTTLRARAYAYARARPPLREREPLKNNLL